MSEWSLTCIFFVCCILFKYMWTSNWLWPIYEEDVYLQSSVSQYRLMWTYKYNITQNKT